MTRLLGAIVATLGLASVADAQQTGMPVSGPKTSTQPPPIVCRNTGETVQCQQSVEVNPGDQDAEFRPLASATFSADELRVAGADTASQIAFARAVAGATIGDARIYVDGMPASAPPASAIGRLTVNGDPMSAEFSNVDLVRVDIDLRPPDRHWHFDGSPPGLSGGGGSPLVGNAAHAFSSDAFGVGGPLPWTAVTFFIRGSHASQRDQPAVAPFGSQSLAPATSPSASSAAAVSAEAVYATPRVLVRTTMFDDRNQGSHAGVGGINGSNTGFRRDSTSERMQTTWRISHGAVVERGGLTISADTMNTLADSDALETVVTGQYRAGGADVSAATRETRAIRVKDVAEHPGGRNPWKVGLELTDQGIRDTSTPDPAGRIQMSAVDSPTGTWFVGDGVAHAAVASATAAIFAEATLLRTSTAAVRGGMRIDWQSRYAPIVEPRISASGRRHGVQFSAGAGLFAQSVSSEILLAARESQSAPILVFRDVVAGALPAIDSPAAERLYSTIDSAFRPRRDFVVRAGAMKSWKALSSGAEEIWTFGEHLAGTTRAAEGGEWTDTIASDRSLRRQQTILRETIHRRALALSAHYTFTRSFDNAEVGVIPAAADVLITEWAPSTGVPRHAAGLTALATTVRGIRVTAAVDARAGLPYNVITGRDGGLATYADRGGLPRNAGVLPPSCKVSATAMKTVRPLARLPAFDLGVRADNLLDRVNVLSVGRVVGSPFFGRPLAASPGRSIAVWAVIAP